jgi:hypothetical protein
MNKNIDYKKKFLKYKKKYDKIIQLKKNQKGGSKKKSKIINILKESKNMNHDSFKFKAIGLLYLYLFDNEKEREKINRKYKEFGGIISYLNSLNNNKFNKEYINIFKKYI